MPRAIAGARPQRLAAQGLGGLGTWGLAACPWVWAPLLAAVLCGVHAEPSRFIGFDQYGHVRVSDAPAHTAEVRAPPAVGAEVTATEGSHSAWPGT